MRTAIVSDLHLGTSFSEDLLRDPGLRQPLLEEVASADRLVLLGDVLELRELPLPAVLDAARPFFEELGEAMAGREILLVPGNHDHRLAEPLLERVAIDRDVESLGLEHREAADEGLSARIRTWLGNTDLEIVYPGIWLRDDVYATHGHYMDCHMSLPRVECVAAAAVMRVFGALPDSAGPADYEKVLRPIYGLSTGLTEPGLGEPGQVQRTQPSALAWRAISRRRRTGGGRLRHAAARATIGAGLGVGVWSVNRLLHADFEADISGAAITRSGIDAATELTRRLGLGAAHVITGHTHRAGPEAGDREWRLPGGGRLHNTGSWVFSTAFHRPGTPPGPYWPGTVTWLEDEGPPRRVRLLNEHPQEDLRRATRR